MAVNKVVINDEVVLDLTGDTVQAADLPKGVIAHSATGDKVTGTTNYAGSSNAGGSATSAEKLNNRLTIKLFLSTLSLRRATAKVHKTVGHFCAYETNFMGIASSC